MLSFMYTGEYDDGKVPDWASERPLAGRSPSLATAQGSNQGHDAGSGNGTKIHIHTSPNRGKGQEAINASSREIESGNQPEALSEMKVNAVVYACGDKFGIPRLKDAALVKFANSLPEKSQDPYLEEVFDLVLQTTMPGDSGIRYDLLLWCIERRGDISNSLAEMMARNEPLAWKVYLEGTKRLNALKSDVECCKALLKVEDDEEKAKDVQLDKAVLRSRLIKMWGPYMYDY
jgi:hypothetical protein